MKVLIIPDVHLKPWIFDYADEVLKRGEAEISVCLGDLVDDFNQQKNIALYQETLDRAGDYFSNHSDALFVYGNHDLSYLWNKRESGYSDYAYETAARSLIRLYRKIPFQQLAFVHRIDHVLFSHAGITETFVANNVPDVAMVNTGNADGIDMIIHKINELGPFSMWEDSSPIWVRPQGFYEDAGRKKIRMFRPDVFLQVVGHTPMEEITYEKTEYKNLLSCDVFSTYRSGEPLGNEQLCVLDTETWQWKGIPTR